MDVICGLKVCMQLEDVLLNTMAKLHVILSSITKDIAIRILRGSQIRNYNETFSGSINLHTSSLYFHTSTVKVSKDLVKI